MLVETVSFEFLCLLMGGNICTSIVQLQQAEVICYLHSGFIWLMLDCVCVCVCQSDSCMCFTTNHCSALLMSNNVINTFFSYCPVILLTDRRTDALWWIDNQKTFIAAFGAVVASGPLVSWAFWGPHQVNLGHACKRMWHKEQLLQADITLLAPIVRVGEVNWHSDPQQTPCFWHTSPKIITHNSISSQKSNSEVQLKRK